MSRPAVQPEELPTLDRRVLQGHVLESRPAAAALPIAVSARGAAGLFNLGVRTWWRLHSAGRVPSPHTRIGRSVRWDVAELLSWWSARCPSRQQWEDRQEKRLIGS